MDEKLNYVLENGLILLSNQEDNDIVSEYILPFLLTKGFDLLTLMHCI